MISKKMANFSYLSYSRIWLNLLMDDHQSRYITKIEETKKALDKTPK
jgi:hypothetical protein